MVTWVEHMQNRGKSPSLGGAASTASSGSSEMPEAACFAIQRLINPDLGGQLDDLDDEEQEQEQEQELLEKWVAWLDQSGKLSALKEFYEKFMIDQGHANKLSDMNDALAALSDAGFILSRLDFGFWDDHSHLDIDLLRCLK